MPDRIGYLKGNLSYSDLKERSKEELIRLILESTDIEVPISVFSGSLPPLTSLVKYLSVSRKLSVKEIASRLNRHEQTIWTVLRNSRRSKATFAASEITVPLSIFCKDRHSILESLTNYLTVERNMRIGEIALLLNKSIKTIWTCQSRFDKKGEKNG